MYHQYWHVEADIQMKQRGYLLKKRPRTWRYVQARLPFVTALALLMTTVGVQASGELSCNMQLDLTLYHKLLPRLNASPMDKSPLSTMA